MDLKAKLQAIADKTGHAALSPSQLPRIMKCPASPYESTFAPIPEQTEYAALGELKHEATEDVVYNGIEALNKYTTLTLDDKNHVLDAVDYLNKVIREYESPHLVKVVAEVKTSLDSFGLPMVHGTCDIKMWRDLEGRIDIIDWKFGQGVQVYAEGNEQCLAYAAGAIGYPNNIYKNVNIHIAQPPLHHYDVWQVEWKDIESWVFTDLDNAIEAIFKENPEYVPGDKQCRFCPAAVTCKARHKKNQQNAVDIFAGYKILPTTTKEQLAAMLEKGKELKKYIAQIEKYAEDEIMKGRPFPGKKAVRGRSSRSWADEATAFKWLNQYSKIELPKLYTKKLISPAQAEKLCRELKKDNDFKSLVRKSEGKIVIADSDDKRPAVELRGPAESVFKELAET